MCIYLGVDRPPDVCLNRGVQEDDPSDTQHGGSIPPTSIAMVRELNRDTVGNSVKEPDLDSQPHGILGVNWFRLGVNVLSVDGTQQQTPTTLWLSGRLLSPPERHHSDRLGDLTRVPLSSIIEGSTGPCSPAEEALDLKSTQGGFESHHGYCHLQTNGTSNLTLRCHPHYVNSSVRWLCYCPYHLFHDRLVEQPRALQPQMNIFVVDRDPLRAAKQLPDKHVTKMILESAQMLSLVFSEHYWNIGTVSKVDGTPFNTKRGAFKNHPCTQWAAESESNCAWLIQHALGLCGEFYRRYGKHHGLTKSLFETKKLFCQHTKLPITIFRMVESFARAMPDNLKYNQKLDDIEAYRVYLSTKPWAYENYLRRPERRPDWLQPYVQQ